MKRLLGVLAIIALLASCGNERRMMFNFDEIKPELNLSTEQETKFDEIIKKYDDKRQENFAAARESGNMDRMAMMEKMQKMQDEQNAEIVAFLNEDQAKVYTAFIKKNNRFQRNGYSDELLATLNDSLKLDENQQKMLVAINKAFEKSYVDAHDYYHGNNEAAREYWYKFDDERKKAVGQMLADSSKYETFLQLVDGQSFRGEHGGGDPDKEEEVAE